MTDRLNDRFRDLHSTLARLRLLTHLTDENVMLDAAGQQDLSEWLHYLATLAADQAVEVEALAFEVAREGEK